MTFLIAILLLLLLKAPWWAYPLSLAVWLVHCIWHANDLRP